MSHTAALRNKWFYAVVLFAIVLGLGGGAATSIFIYFLDLFHQLLWITLPDALGIKLDWVYIIPVCLIGGVLVGLINKHLGNYPKTMDEALAHFKQTGKFDYKDLPQSVLGSYASLTFGAALGPESALVNLVGGISSWIGSLIKTPTENAKILGYIGVSSSLAALFGSPLVSSAIAYQQPKDKEFSRIWTVAPALAAGLAGLWVFETVNLGGSFFDFNFLPYTFAIRDVLPAVLVGAIAGGFGLLFMGVEVISDRLIEPLNKRPVLKAVIGGIGLGILASLTSLVLFSGHEGIQEIMDEFGQLSVLFLLAVAVAKLVAAGFLLATGWKGGKFFPTMFAGAAVGLALATATGFIAPMIGVAAGMAGTLAACLKKPAIVILLLVFFFPLDLWVTLIVGAFIGAEIGKRFGPKKAT